MSKFRNYDKYEIYEDGRIFSYISKKFLKPQTNKYGYQIVKLSDNDCKFKTYTVHKIVYESFTGKPIPEDMKINHIDERKENNARSNLELVTHKENCNFGTRNARISKAMTNGKLSKAVGAYKDGELVMIFPSTMEAQRNGFSCHHISSCCRGKRKTHKGYTWRYL